MNRRPKTSSAPFSTRCKNPLALYFFQHAKSQSVNHSVNRSIGLSIMSGALTCLRSLWMPAHRFTPPPSLGSASARINSLSDRGEHHLDAHTLYVQFTHTHASAHRHTEPWQPSSVALGSFEVQQKCSNVTALGDRLLAPWHPYYSQSSPLPPRAEPAHLRRHLHKTCTCSCQAPSSCQYFCIVSDFFVVCFFVLFFRLHPTTLL